MDKEQVIDIVREYKRLVNTAIDDAQVYLYGSYSKGNAHANSDIDVAVVVPQVKGDWLDVSAQLWMLAPQVNYQIEPVLIEKRFASPLYDDVMRTGVAV